MSQDSGGFDLDSILDKELQSKFGGLAAPNPLPTQALYQHALLGGTAMSMLANVVAALTTKAAAGAAAVVLVGGAATGTLVTGSPNPTVWGQTVVAAVQGCKTAEAAADKTPTTTATNARINVGRCVSAVAKQHGEAERDEHSKAPSPHPSGRPSDRPEGKPSDHPTGKPSDTPGGRPSDHPTGKPSDTPGGKPSDHPGGQGDGADGKPTETPGGRPVQVPPTTPPGHRP